MANPVMADLPPSTNIDFDGLAIPPLDPSYFEQTLTSTGQENNMGGSDSFEFQNNFMFDDIDFSLCVDDIFSDEDAVLSPDFMGCLGELPGLELDPIQMNPNFFDQHPIGNFNDSSQILGGSGHFSGDRAEEGAVNIDSSSSPEVDRSSGDQSSSGSGGYLNVASPESNGSNPEVSEESGNEKLGLSDARITNWPSPESQGSDNHPSDSKKPVNSSKSFANDSIKSCVVEQKIKFGEVKSDNSNCSSLLKRKKRSDDSSNISKYQKSTNVTECGSIDNFNGEEDEKKRARLMRNRESAQLSRQRRKQYVQELEDKVRKMYSTIQDLTAKFSYAMAENATLKSQLSGTIVPPQMPPPPPGMYPHPPVMYPWMPPPYRVNPQGSQVPLVPIPRLKPQAAAPAPAPKSSKKVEKKKSAVRTKKVASISFLGLLFFMLLFGGLVPIVNMRYGGAREPFSSGNIFGSGFHEKHHGRVLAVDGPVNRTGCTGKYSGKGSSTHCSLKGQGESNQTYTNKSVDESVRMGNGSDPLVASLYVPRNDKLVKIDGNLIIHSILASEKAMSSHGSSGKESRRETGLSVPGDLAPAIPERHPLLYRNPAVGQRALGSGEKENSKSTEHQWFLEGVAGPMLSSGMCTEVFQFDVSSAPGAVVPATTVRNASMELRHNATRLNKGRNRRILNGPSVPLSEPFHNVSENHAGRTGKQETFSGNKSLSSMVVSVLVDPREAGDADGDGMMGPKSLSRIFVVVLVDSVKYVTYSCMLPFKGSLPI